MRPKRFKTALKFIFLSILLLTLCLKLFFSLSEEFSELYTLYIAPFFRVPLSALSSVFPFSLFESVIGIFIILTAVTLLSGVKLLVNKIRGKKRVSHFITYLKIVSAMAVYAYVIFTLSFEASYYRIPISETLRLPDTNVNESTVTAALDKVTDRLAELEDEIAFREGYATQSPYDFNTMSKKVLEGARRASEKYPVFQKYPFKAKLLAFSRPMAYTGLSGVYGYFTGESNINSAFSDYSMPFTVAHEYAHQMGIGSEKEAEFSALLICLECDDPYIRYSAYSQVAITLSNLLYTMDEDAFYSAYEKFPRCLVTDVYMSSKKTQQYRDTVVDDIATNINDAYLSSHGDEGVVSYSMSAKLYIAYFSRR